MLRILSLVVAFINMLFKERLETIQNCDVFLCVCCVFCLVFASPGGRLTSNDNNDILMMW